MQSYDISATRVRSRSTQPVTLKTLNERRPRVKIPYQSNTTDGIPAHVIRQTNENQHTVVNGVTYIVPEFAQ